MAKYRKVDTKIWNDQKFSDAKPITKLVFLFLLTHPNLTILGAMRATLSGLAAELRVSPQRFKQGFSSLVSMKMVDFDPTACFLSLPNYLKYNEPDTPNVVIAWKDAYNLLPECPLRTSLLDRALAIVQAKHYSFQVAFAKAFPERLSLPLASPAPGPSAIQEQEQEQEQEKEQEQDKTPLPPSKGADALIPEKLAQTPGFLSAWSEWLAFRRDIRKPLRVYGQTRQLKMLAEQADPVAIIQVSLTNQYQGLFPPKGPAAIRPADPADSSPEVTPEIAAIYHKDNPV